MAARLPGKLNERLFRLRDGMLTGLVERDIAIRLALLAALSGEHLVLLGPPGTAKSLIARRLKLAFRDATSFERLLTRFTVPEELFGPLSIKGLEEDRYERLTEAYLPTASIAFLDEIFKANSAILNALLTLLNEREFDNGAHRVRTPLVAVVGASNELPEGEELDALYDRFLLRLHVGPVGETGFRDLLRLRGDAVPDVGKSIPLKTSDLDAIREHAVDVVVPPDVEELLCKLRLFCAAEEIPVSDRRWRKVVKLLQVAALTNGKDEVSIWDCWLLQHCLWSRPEDREKLHAWYAERVGASQAMDPASLTTIVTALEGRLKRDRDSRTQMTNKDGKLLYKARNGKLTTSKEARVQAARDGEPLFLAPKGAGNRYGSLDERTNNSAGYTQAELDTLWVNDTYYGRRQFTNWSGRTEYLAERSNMLLTDAPLRPALEPTPHKPAYVAERQQQLSGVRTAVETYQRKLKAHIASLEAEITGHLWVTDDFAEPAAASLDETRRKVDALLVRLDRLERGYSGLPVEA